MAVWDYRAHGARGHILPSYCNSAYDAQMHSVHGSLGQTVRGAAGRRKQGAGAVAMMRPGTAHMYCSANDTGARGTVVDACLTHVLHRKSDLLPTWNVGVSPSHAECPT